MGCGLEVQLRLWSGAAVHGCVKNEIRRIPNFEIAAAQTARCPQKPAAGGGGLNVLFFSTRRRLRGAAFFVVGSEGRTGGKLGVQASACPVGGTSYTSPSLSAYADTLKRELQPDSPGTSGLPGLPDLRLTALQFQTPISAQAMIMQPVKLPVQSPLPTLVIGIAVLAGGCATPAKIGSFAPRTGDEIVVAGRYVHTGT